MKDWLYRFVCLVALAGISYFSLSAADPKQMLNESQNDMIYFIGNKVINAETAETKSCFHYVDDTIVSGRTFDSQETEQDSLSLTEDERYLLAKIAMAEAEGEDTKGKALVMLVVINRVRAVGFPNTVEEVIYQPRQFSPVANGRFDRMEPNEDCWEALSMIEVNGWDESMGATYFESKSDSTWHAENLHFLFLYGSHYFYSE